MAYTQYGDIMEKIADYLSIHYTTVSNIITQRKMMFQDPKIPDAAEYKKHVVILLSIYGGLLGVLIFFT